MAITLEEILKKYRKQGIKAIKNDEYNCLISSVLNAKCWNPKYFACQKIIWEKANLEKRSFTKEELMAMLYLRVLNPDLPKKPWDWYADLEIYLSAAFASIGKFFAA